MIKIYFNDKKLFLTEAIDAEVASYIDKSDTLFMYDLNREGVDRMIQEMSSSHFNTGVYFHPNFTRLKEAFFKKFRLIQAGGGAVVNEARQLLLIFRRGKWDLPKGKLDPGESLDTCAMREVQEETGLKNLRLQRLLLVTYHTYEENQNHILKETYWYFFKTKGDQRLEPQLEEQITKIEWVGRSQLSNYTSNTYPLIIDVIKTIS